MGCALHEFVERYRGDGQPGAVPGQLVVCGVKRVDFQKRFSGAGGGDRLQGVNAIQQSLALQRGQQAPVVLILRLDRNDVAALANDWANRRVKNLIIGADVDDQRTAGRIA